MVEKIRSERLAGFTLIEMMIVIIILGFIVTVATISLTSANRTSQVAACKADFKAVSGALATYRNDRVDDLTDLTLYPPFPTPPGVSLVNLGYMVPLIENGSYRIYLTTGAANVSVQIQSEGVWTPVSPAVNSEADCDAISFAGQQ